MIPDGDGGGDDDDDDDDDDDVNFVSLGLKNNLMVWIFW